MNLKQLVILLVLVVVVGGAGLVVFRGQRSSWSSGSAGVGKKLLGDFQINDVGHIVIKHGTNELNLVRKDGAWRVRERHDYPANFGDISSFLIKAQDLKVVQTETAGPSILPRLQLEPGNGTNAATELDLLTEDNKPIRTLFLGKKHMKTPTQPNPMSEGGDEGWPDGRWVKVGNSSTVDVITDPLENMEPNADQWVNKDFFKVDKAKSIAVTFPVATNSWALSRDTESGEWKLADAKPGEQLDSTKTTSLSNPLSSPTFNDVSPGGKLDGAGTNAPTVVKIDTFDNFHYTVTVGAKTNDDYPLTVTTTAEIAKDRTPGKDEKPEDKAKLDKDFKDAQQKLEDKLKQEQSYADWTYTVSSWSLDPILKERSQLLAEKTNALPAEALATNLISRAEGTNTDGTNAVPSESVSNILNQIKMGQPASSSKQRQY